MLRLGDAPFAVVSAGLPRPWGRSRDRRASLERLLGALAEHLRAGREAPSLTACFEAALRETLRAQSVRVRENPAPGAADAGSPSEPGRQIATEVPTRRGARRVVIETTLDSALALDSWDRQVLQSAAQVAALVVEIDQLRATPRRPLGVVRRPEPGMPPIIGSSAAVMTLRENIDRVAATDFTVLIQGESGTGKELVARQLHHLSRRRCGPFVAVNCAALVESLLEAELFGIEDRTATGVRGRRGKFEHADGGTLFLDEVSDLTPSAQAKLLRAIQELVVERVGGHTSRRVDTRIIVATNKDLRELALNGRFREDLYYRLSGVELHVPPLRARREDIPELCAYFLSRYQTRGPLTLSAEASEAMQVYDWPGNVRELERLIEGTVTLAASEWVTIGDLPPALRGESVEALDVSLRRNDSMRAWGARYARLVFERCRQNKRRACDALDISYHTLMAYLDFRPESAASRRHRVAWANDSGGDTPPRGGEGGGPIGAAEQQM
jgi:transcriptional regulator with PAS, ATPase and Fis domain